MTDSDGPSCCGLKRGSLRDTNKLKDRTRDTQRSLWRTVL